MFRTKKRTFNHRVIFYFTPKLFMVGALFFILPILLIQSTAASHEDEKGRASYSSNSILPVLTNKEDELKILKNIEKKHENPEFRILFLCTGNSCRSQMAEGWTRHLGGEAIKVQSAGIEAHGLNPRAIKVMEDFDIDISGQTSKTVDSNMLEWADLVVTVCGHADERCPLLPRKTPKLHWPIIDPAQAKGEEEEVLTVFRSVTNVINRQVVQLLEVLKKTNHIH